MDVNPIPKKKLFICKFCNKKYPCGKSLGGHIRIHLSGSNGNNNNGNVNVNVNSNNYSNSTTDDVEEDADLIKLRAFSGSNNNSKKDHSEDTGGQSSAAGYGLRENPKKTRRFMAGYSNHQNNNNNNLLQGGKVCKECGKGFQSLKALCGHMASHSKISFEDQSADTTTEKLLKDQVFDSQSDDTETSSATPSKRRRSTRRMRYNNKTSIDVYSSSSALSLPNASISMSSAASDYLVEHEQEEVAMCLMMLSKDSGFRGCFSSIADFEDNNSVFVDTKSSSSKLRISVKNGINCVYNANGILQQTTKKSKQNHNSGVSDSGYLRNGTKKVQPEISVNGFDRFRKQKSGRYGCRYEEEEEEDDEEEDDEFSPQMGKRLSRFRRIKTDLGKDRIIEGGYDESSRKRGKNNDSYNTEFVKAKALKTAKCPSAGGGIIKGSHRTSNGYNESIYESGENSIDVPNRKTNFNGKTPIVQNAGLKKGKVHECPFCYKVFRSGQALGGHKRSHFVGGGSEDRTVVIDHRVPEVSMSGLIDLNLPAPIEEDTNGYYLASW